MQISKEHQRVQPRSTSISSRGSISTVSRGSIKSDPFAGYEDTSSISARSDTSVDSYVFDPSFGIVFTLSSFDCNKTYFILQEHLPESNGNSVLSFKEWQIDATLYLKDRCVLIHLKQI